MGFSAPSSSFGYSAAVFEEDEQDAVYSYALPESTFSTTYSLAAANQNAQTIKTSVQPISSLQSNAVITTNIDPAQTIRDNAGIACDEETGIQTGVSVGHSGLLTVQSSYTITNETQAKSIASSGTGTHNDPYVIANMEWNGGGTELRGIWFNDPDASYHISFENHKLYDFTSEAIRLDSPNVSIENVTGYTSVDKGAFLRFTKGFTLEDSQVTGNGNSAGAILDRTDITEDITVKVSNLLLSDEDGSWPVNGDGIAIRSSHVTAEISHVETLAGMTGGRTIFSIVDVGSDSVFSNIETTGGWRHAFSDRANKSNSKGFTVENVLLVDTSEEAIYFQNLDGAFFNNIEAAHNTTGAGSRLIFFRSKETDSSIRVQNITVQNAKLTKETGGNPGDEVLESWYGENIIFDNIWVTKATEDAVEHVYSLSGNQATNIVGDNVAGQIVDFHKQGQINGSVFEVVTDTSTAPSTDSYFHSIYGNSGSWAVILSGLRGVYGSGVDVDNTAAPNEEASIHVMDRDGVVIRDVYIYGPYPAEESRAGNIYSIAGGININFSDLELSGAFEILTGTYGDDLSLIGTGGNDLIHGLDGNDILKGSGGNDVINGGAGDDVLLYGGSGLDILLGEDGDDELRGGDGDDILNGGNGDDILKGQDGDDILIGGLGDDELNGNQGLDTADYTNNATRVFINLAQDKADDDDDGIIDDTLLNIENATGSSFNDEIIGGSEDSVLKGGDGRDRLKGGNGDDELHGGNGDDYLLYGGNGIDRLFGDAGNDELRGGNDNDIIYGGTGNDVVKGQNGDDLLIGGQGADELTGGKGADTLKWLAGDLDGSVDTIRGFSTSSGDKLDIANILTGYSPLTDAITDFVMITDDGTSSTLAIDIDGGADNFVTVAILVNKLNMTDEQALEASGALITA